MTKKVTLLLIGSQALVILLGSEWGLTMDRPTRPPNYFTYLGGLAIFLVLILGLAPTPWVRYDPNANVPLKTRLLSFFLALYFGALYWTDAFLSFRDAQDFLEAGILLVIIILANAKLFQYRSLAAIGASLFLFVCIAMIFCNTRDRFHGYGFFSWWRMSGP